MIGPTWNPMLLVISAPSGAGKTTLCERLAAEFDSIVYSVSCTTRKPRIGEIDGMNYHFLDEEEFMRRKENGEFLEYANVHGFWYATPRQGVLQALQSGKDVIMDLDVQGAASVREYLRKVAPNDPLRRVHVDVFIAPPSMEDLQLRLFGRGKDDVEVISRRLEEAEEEMSRWEEFQYMILNDRLDVSYDALRSIFLAAHHRVVKNGGKHG